jgi:hypothetical protein
MGCIQRQAELMHRRMQEITSSPEWSQNKCDVVVQVEAGSDDDSYVIEHSHNDELFIINGETFEAKTYCLSMNEGDEVIFLDGSPHGSCASAEVLNIRTKDRCELWCE